MRFLAYFCSLNYIILRNIIKTKIAHYIYSIKTNRGAQRVLAGLCVLLLFLPISLEAQNTISFEASLDQSKVALNDFVEVTFTIKNAQPDSFDPPAFNDFRIAGGPNQVTEMNVVNGAVSRLTTYSFYLSPKAVGRFTIGSAKMEYRGRTFLTKPLAVEITKSGSGSSRNARPNKNAPPPAASLPSLSGFSGFSSGSKSSGKAKKTQLSESQLEKGIFLRAEPSKKEAFLGEQITVEYKLYTKFGLNGKQFTTLPQLRGFFPVEFKQFDSNIHRETVGGTTYAVQTLRKVALYPQKAGVLELDPLGVQVGVIAENPEDALDDPFGFMGAQMVRPYETETPTIKLTIYNLPPDAPSSFKGAVGSFTFSAKAAPQVATTDDAVRLIITLTGNGDLKRLGVPSLGNDSTDFEVYEPKILDHTEETPNDIQLQKQYEFVLLPRKVGTLRLAPSFTYFDTPTRRYKTLQSEPINLVVSAGKKPLATLQPPPPLVGKNKPASVLRPNRLDVSFTKKTNPLLGSRVFWFLLIMPFLVLFIAGFYKWFLYKQPKFNPLRLRRRQAATVAQDRLTQVKAHLDKSEISSFYNELQKVLWSFIRDKFELTTAQLSKEYLATYLPEKGVSTLQIGQFFNLIQHCEMATFGGTIADVSRHSEVFAQASHFIQSFD